MEALTIESAQLAIAVILVLGVFAQWLTASLKIPSILVLLLIGFLIGDMGLQIFNPTKLVTSEVMFDFVSLAVAVILFEGGLSLKFSDLNKCDAVLKRMLWIGIPVCFLVTAPIFKFLFDVSWEFSFLVSSILVVTGPTVIFPLLNQVNPMGRSGPIIKWEGILNDPIGAILAVLMLDIVLSHGHLDSFGDALLGLSVALIGGILGGVICAWMTTSIIDRGWISSHMQGSFAISLCLLLFVLSNSLQEESGLLAVTVYGIVLANQKTVKTNNIRHFHEHLSNIFISILFIVLSSRFTLEHLRALDLNAIIFIASLIIIVRPLCVWLSTFGTNLKWQDRVLIAAMAPRGIVAAAVASLFSLELAHHGVAEAQVLEPIIYAVIVGTVVVYGLGALPLAKLLGLRPPEKDGVLFVGANRLGREVATSLLREGHPVHLIDINRNNVKAAQMEKLSASDLSIIDERLELENEIPSGIDLMMALSDSNEENALAALRYEHEFGVHKVFQIVGKQPNGGNARELRPSVDYSGNLLFDGQYNYDDINKRFPMGLRAVITQITDKYDYNTYCDNLNRHSLQMLVINKNGRIRPIGSRHVEVSAGDKVLALVPG